MYSDKTIPYFSPSPPPPSSPAPAYSALPYRDVDFFCSPLYENAIGDVELETTDGRRFLVHKKLLEAETVFFHIYFGFVPVWRVAGNNQTASNTASSGTLNNLLCLPKLLVNHIRSSTSIPDVGPPVPPKDTPTIVSTEPVAQTAHNPIIQPVNAPTPTNSPYTWVVPETSEVLMAFLHLIYPPNTFASSVPNNIASRPSSPIPTYSATMSSSPINPQTTCLSTLDLTARVIRAALGYQSSKALTLARNHLQTFLQNQPVEVYAFATFFKFADLAKLASHFAMTMPIEQWPRESMYLMGRTGLARLQNLQSSRYTGSMAILDAPLLVPEEFKGHVTGCAGFEAARKIWAKQVGKIKANLGPGEDLLDLTRMDARGSQCGECLMILGENVGRCLGEAKDLPKSI